MVEGFRDFFKRKKKSSATYPASELTTIVNLISNLAKKFGIKVDTGAIVDEFEAMLKSQNIDLQEQDDRLMIGADLNLTLDKAPKLKQFMIDLKGESPQALQLLVKALKKGAFDVPDEQQATPVAPAPAPEAETEAGGKFPIVITKKEITDLIQKQSSEKLEKMLKQAGIDDFSGDKLKQMIARQNLLPLFDEYLNDSDVGDYFRLEGKGEVKEQIDIKKVFGARSGRETQILTFAFGVFLRAYIAKETKRLLSQGIEIPKEKLTQLNKSVINLSKKSLQNALKSSIKKPEPVQPAPTAVEPEEEEEESEQNGLKSLSRAEINQALGPIKNFGKLDIKKVRQEIENNISKQLSGNPLAKKIKSKQMPNVMKVLDQVEKILTGDFENLVSESDSKKLINLISEEIIKVINE
tara:strand:- start:65 stop:1294 length:1230 start_codon:yes stop_codon:yes gene_type:complete